MSDKSGYNKNLKGFARNLLNKGEGKKQHGVPFPLGEGGRGIELI